MSEEKKECPWCHDTGWIARDVDGLGVATRCECIARTHSEQVLPKAQIPSKYTTCDLEDNFVIPQQITKEARGQLQFILATVKAYAHQFPMRSDPRGLLFYGANGVGKTHLAVAALRRILDKGHEGRFINYQALLRLIRGSYDQPFGSIERTAEYDAIEDVQVLLLDDVGSNRVNGWVEDTITELIAQRHDNERATIVTTNYSPDREQSVSDKAREVPLEVFPCLADRIGERATSRLREMCKIIAMPSGLEDHRGKKEPRR